MSEVCAYLAIGVALYLLTQARNRRRRRIDGPSIAEILQEKQPDKLGPVNRAVTSALAAAMALVVAVVAWPLIVLIWAVDWVLERRRPCAAAGAEAELPFTVLREHLLDRLTLSRIESRERVEDPLHAVPPVPFGHLHGAWRTFAETLEPGDELWSFAADWHSGGWHDRRKGYAAVRGGEVASFFVAEIQSFGHHPPAGGDDSLPARLRRKAC